MDKDTEIFRGKNFSDILKDVYENTKKKERQIIQLIADLKPLVSNVKDAMLVVPLIADYLEIAVKNDEHLVKMAAIVQRMINRSKFEGDDVMITEDEKEELMREYEELENENKIIKEEKSKLQDEIVTSKTGVAGEENEQ
ncbi:MAG: hypothetical protein H8E98_02970 [Bacteroidetes bacterium]|nr:hypothetical protein [Bacteroidota bacterium]